MRLIDDSQVSDLTGYLTGGGSTAPSFGYSLTSALSGGGAGSSASSSASGLLGLASGAASLLPGGAILSPLISAFGGLFGGGGVGYGTTEFDGLHSPTLPELPASSMKTPECGIYRAYATGLGISVEEVDIIMHQDSRQNGHDMLYVIDAYRNTNLDNARTYLRAWNAANPAAMIHEGEKGPRSTGDYGNYTPVTTAPVYSTGGAVAGNGFTGAATTSPIFTTGAPVTGNSLTAGEYLSQILAGAVKGAQTGAGSAVADTPAGQQAKKDVINDYIKTYQLPLAAAGAGLIWLIYKASNK